MSVIRTNSHTQRFTFPCIQTYIQIKKSRRDENKFYFQTLFSPCPITKDIIWFYCVKLVFFILCSHMNLYQINRPSEPETKSKLPAVSTQSCNTDYSKIFRYLFTIGRILPWAGGLAKESILVGRAINLALLDKNILLRAIIQEESSKIFVATLLTTHLRTSAHFFSGITFSPGTREFFGLIIGFINYFSFIW